MTIARILSAGTAAALIVLGSAALAQEANKEAHTGTITGINRLNDSIAIRQTQGGTVGVRSNPGHGSVFHAVLPRETAAIPAR